MPTLKLATGFEHGLSNTTSLVKGNAGSLYADALVASPAIVTSTPRNGSYCLEIATTAAAENISWGTGTMGTGQAVYVVGFAIRFPSALPSADVQLAYLTSAASKNLCLSFRNSDDKLLIDFHDGTGTEQASANAVVADTWYWIDMRGTISGTNRTCDWAIDGTPQTQFTGTDVSDTAFSSFRLGTSNADTMTVRYDDAVASTTTGDYPLGKHEVILLKADTAGTATEIGTVNATARFTGNATTDATFNSANILAAISEVPPLVGATASGLAQRVLSATSAAAIPMTTYTLSAGESFSGLRVTIPGWSSSATANQYGFRTFNGTTETILQAGTVDPNFDADTAAPAWFCEMATGSEFDTQGEVDAFVMRIGYSGDVTPNPGVHAVYAELAVKEATASSAEPQQALVVPGPQMPGWPTPYLHIEQPKPGAAAPPPDVTPPKPAVVTAQLPPQWLPYVSNERTPPTDAAPERPTVALGPGQPAEKPYLHVERPPTEAPPAPEVPPKPTIIRGRHVVEAPFVGWTGSSIDSGVTAPETTPPKPTVAQGPGQPLLPNYVFEAKTTVAPPVAAPSVIIRPTVITAKDPPPPADQALIGWTVVSDGKPPKPKIARGPDQPPSGPRVFTHKLPTPPPVAGPATLPKPTIVKGRTPIEAPYVGWTGFGIDSGVQTPGSPPRPTVARGPEQPPSGATSFTHRLPTAPPAPPGPELPPRPTVIKGRTPVEAPFVAWNGYAADSGLQVGTPRPPKIQVITETRYPPPAHGRVSIRRGFEESIPPEPQFEDVPYRFTTGPSQLRVNADGEYVQVATGAGQVRVEADGEYVRLSTGHASSRVASSAPQALMRVTLGDERVRVGTETGTARAGTEQGTTRVETEQETARVSTGNQTTRVTTGLG